uniref:USP domain-containing protein n=1 Tax=Heterorhabditis bacteriophora TaxID=37862 RepID=A0A1I7X459_HETBA
MSARNSVVSLSSNGSSRVETRLMDTPSRPLSIVSHRCMPEEGAMLPSSSSKDDDLLSTSSDEVENMAMQTLVHLGKNKSVVSTKSDNSDDDLKKIKLQNEDFESELEDKVYILSCNACKSQKTVPLFHLFTLSQMIFEDMYTKIVHPLASCPLVQLTGYQPSSAKHVTHPSLPPNSPLLPSLANPICTDTCYSVTTSSLSDLHTLTIEIAPNKKCGLILSISLN